MKKLRILMLWAVLTIASPAVVVTTTSCTATQERITYNSLATTAHGVDAAYKSYLDLVIAGKVATNTVPKVSKQYSDFQAGFKVALALAHGNSNAVPSVELKTTAVDLVTSITEAKKAK